MKTNNKSMIDFIVKGSHFCLRCVTGHDLYKAHFFVKNVLVTYWIHVNVTRLLLDCCNSRYSFFLWVCHQRCCLISAICEDKI